MGEKEIFVFKHSDMNWTKSSNTIGWEFVMLSGSSEEAYSVLCRCPAGVVYSQWVSDGISELYVTKGSIALNGIELNTGEYGRIEAGAESIITAITDMEMLAVMHGKVKRAYRVFGALRKGPISREESKELSSLPWIDHLRKHATDEDLAAICNWLAPTHDEYLIELCIGIARNLKDNAKLTEVVQKVLDGSPGLSLRISSVLYLASKGKMDNSLWDFQLQEMEKDPTDFLRINKHFYSAKSNQDLIDVVNEKRKNTGKYEYNKPYYELLFRMAS